MDIPILKYLDVLIGLSIVMLVVATAALSISQALLNMCAARARHLAQGLESVIWQLHPTLLGPHAHQISRQVLLHPVVCQPRHLLNRFLFDPIRRVLHLPTPLPTSDGRVAGGVILREELAFCLIEWASGEWGWANPAKADAAGRQAAEAEALAAAAEAEAKKGDAPNAAALRSEAERTAKDAEEARHQADDELAAHQTVLKRQRDLAAALKDRGIEDPAATLRAVRVQAMENEKAHPEQSAQLWRSQALVQVAPSEFVASLFQSFDTAMARATASFASEAQVWVSAVALVLVVLLQLDTFTLTRRLSIDDSYRQTLVAEAQRLNDAHSALVKQRAEGGAPAEGAQVAGTQPVGTQVGEAQGSAAEQLALPKDDSCAAYKPAATNASATPNAPGDDLKLQVCEINRSLTLLHSPTLDIWPDNQTLRLRNVPGILVTWLLVSLGAPFWYDLLKNLFQLRSVLAQRDQSDRNERTAAAPTTTVVTKPANGSNGGAASTQTAGNTDVHGTGEMGDLSATGAQG